MLPTLKISYPFKPFLVTQKWGNPSDAYSKQFNDPNFTLHNGIDAVAVYPNLDGSETKASKWPVYCPVEEFRVLSVDYAPQGGGNEIWLISKDKMQVLDKECHVMLVLCHADKVLVKAGDEPQLGELLMVSDNTGFSTGEHTHFGMYRVDYNGTWYTKLDINNATGSIDPAQFFTGLYAVDQASASLLLQNNLRYYRYKLGL